MSKRQRQLSDRAIPISSQDSRAKFIFSSRDSVPPVVSGITCELTNHSPLKSRRILTFTDSNPASVPSSANSRKNSSVLLFNSPFRLNASRAINQTTPSPIKLDTRKLLNLNTPSTRIVQKTPYKVLDAPDLQDDFYLNLVDWSYCNVLAVGLGSCVYLWSAVNSKVTRLCDLKRENFQETVTSVSWNSKGTHLSIGTSKGTVEIWDVTKQKRIRDLKGHDSRVGTLAWSHTDPVICTGSRDRSIKVRDLRTKTIDSTISTLHGHRQEVCGLKWAPGTLNLASGGNDNKLLIWDMRKSHITDTPTPIQIFKEHEAAVKAIAWSPHDSGLLASGGGTADQKIRFWNTCTGTSLSTINTSSQVCNLAWSNTSNEIISTHGYSQNQVVLWKVVNTKGNIPALESLTTLTGHTMRVLYLAVSPDNQSIVTGAGDETLRFWNVFDKKNKEMADSFGHGASYSIR